MPPLIRLAIALCLVFGACSDSREPTPYPYDNETRVIGGGQQSGSGSASDVGDGSGDSATSGGGSAGDGSVGSGSAITGSGTAAAGAGPVESFDTPTGDDCILLDDVCVQPQSECGEGASADVIVDENGQVLSTVCYPNKNYEVVELGDRVEDPALGNNQVIVLDDEDDGADVVGDLVVEGNNVIVWGDDPATSVIGGDLQIDKNNAIVRGVGVDGDVTISKNNASLLYCIIRGDLTITGNNVNLALCDIYGDVTIEGNNAVFVSNRVEGEQPIEGVNLRCNDNWRFDDADDDGVVDDGEVGERIACVSRDSAVADDADLDTRLSP